MKLTHLATAALLALGLTSAQAQQGVSKTEITVGSILDLSGPLAGYGKPARSGMQLRFDELNEQGGVHGRKIRLVVEDDGYDPRKAVLAAQKLVNQNKVFTVMGHLGTAHNMAAMPIQFEKNVSNFYPLTAAREMYEPFHRLKFAILASYYEQMRLATPYMMKQKNAKKVCAIYQDDEFGLDVVRGAEAGLKAAGTDLAERTTYKRGATDFSSQVARLKAANCDMVVMGTIIRETVGVLAEARKIGLDATFLGSVAAYTDLIHKLGGKAVEGFYAAMTFSNPYLDDTSDKLRFWANKYKTKFSEDPNVFSVYGYLMADHFIQAAQAAGPNLNVDSFVKAMESVTFQPDMFGGPLMKFSPTSRLASNETRLSVIENGRWKVITEYFNK